MAPIPDVRFEPLCKIYHPKKVTHAAIELVDTPGLSRTHEGNATRMAMIREAGCLVFVVAAFDGTDPAADLRSFDEDLVLADMEIVTNRIQRVEDQLKKPLAAAGTPAVGARTRHAEDRAGGDGVGPAAARVAHDRRAAEGHPRVPAVERKAAAGDRQHGRRRIAAGAFHGAFHAGDAGDGRARRLGIGTVEDEPRRIGRSSSPRWASPSTDRDHLIRTLLKASRQTTFFTAGEPEVRTWLLHEGGTAVEAAGGIHTDLARGFIRAEVMTVTDLVRLGSEREIKAHHLLRQEPKDYVVKDDDILLIRFSV